MATSLAIAVSEGLTERQVTALASFFAVLGQSLGAIASNMAGVDVETGVSATGSATQTSAGTGSGNEMSAGYTAVTGVKVTRDVDVTPTGTHDWHYRTAGATGAAGITGATGTQPSPPSNEPPGTVTKS